MPTAHSEPKAPRHLTVLPPAAPAADGPAATAPPPHFLTGPPGAGDGRETLLGVVPLGDGGRLMVVVGRIVGPDGLDPGPPPEPPAPGRPGDDLLIDRATWRVVARGARVDLTFQEFALLDRLASAPGRVFTRPELLERVWGSAAGLQTRTVDVHIHRLRRKLGPLGERITTVRRVGYVYQRA